jgi:hypothetical protein
VGGFRVGVGQGGGRALGFVPQAQPPPPRGAVPAAPHLGGGRRGGNKVSGYHCQRQSRTLPSRRGSSPCLSTPSAAPSQALPQHAPRPLTPRAPRPRSPRTCMPITSRYHACDFSRSPTRSMTLPGGGGGWGGGVAGAGSGGSRRAGPAAAAAATAASRADEVARGPAAPLARPHLAQRLLGLGALDELPLVAGGVLGERDHGLTALDRARLARDLAARAPGRGRAGKALESGGGGPGFIPARPAPAPAAAPNRPSGPRTLPPPALILSASLYTSGVATPKWPKPCTGRAGGARAGAAGCFNAGAERAAGARRARGCGATAARRSLGRARAPRPVQRLPISRLGPTLRPPPQCRRSQRRSCRSAGVGVGVGVGVGGRVGGGVGRDQQGGRSPAPAARRRLAAR